MTVWTYQKPGETRRPMKRNQLGAGRGAHRGELHDTCVVLLSFEMASRNQEYHGLSSNLPLMVQAMARINQVSSIPQLMECLSPKSEAASNGEAAPVPSVS